MSHLVGIVWENQVNTQYTSWKNIHYQNVVDIHSSLLPSPLLLVCHALRQIRPNCTLAFSGAIYTHNCHFQRHHQHSIQYLIPLPYIAIKTTWRLSLCWFANEMKNKKIFFKRKNPDEDVVFVLFCIYLYIISHCLEWRCCSQTPCCHAIPSHSIPQCFMESCAYYSRLNGGKNAFPIQF